MENHDQTILGKPLTMGNYLWIPFFDAWIDKTPLLFSPSSRIFKQVVLFESGPNEARWHRSKFSWTSRTRAPTFQARHPHCTASHGTIPSLFSKVPKSRG
jgi:hypothetical protein